MGKHVVWGKASPAATVCGDRAFQTPKHVVECEFLLGTGNPLQRSRRSDTQTCGKMQIWSGPAQPLRTKRGSTVKNWCNIVIESPDASVAQKSNGNNCGKTVIF